MTGKKWRVRSDEAPQKPVYQSLPPLLAAVLHARGVDTAEGVRLALSAPDAPFGDPFAMRDMQSACQRIVRALAEGEKITVFGDYDADGVTATYLVLTYLRGRGAAVDSYIPTRAEGYGLSEAALAQIAARGTTLVITVDTGISGLAEARYAKTVGLDLIITDHHQCGETLPDAPAVLNPRRSDCTYPYKELAGVGVAFTLLRALEGDDAAVLARYGDAVALGTLADVMPLTGENKRLVAEGLRLLCTTENKGLSALVRETAQPRAISPTSVSFSLAPRINAAGRIATADEALALLLAEREEEAVARAKALCAFNDRRREAESRLLASVQEKIEAEWAEIEENRAIVLSGDDWHPGTIGIVAARLAEKYGVPTVLAAREGERLKGSGRGVPGFDLYGALRRACEDLGQCGGHEMAAGLTMEARHFPAFKRAFLAIAKEADPHAEGPVLDIDCAVGGALLTEENVRSLARLAPFGAGNPQPVLALFDVSVRQVIELSGGKHVKLMLEEGGTSFPALCFGKRADGLRFGPGDRIDVAFCAEINHFRGQSEIQLTVQDLRPAKAQRRREREAEEALALLWAEGEDRPPVARPPRAAFAAVWRRLQGLAQGKRCKISPALLYSRVRQEDAADELAVLIALNVFSEAGLIRLKNPAADFNGEQSIYFCETSEKVDLEQTDTMLRLAGAPAEI